MVRMRLICAASPLLVLGFGQCNFNTFPLNGDADLGVPGGFLVPETFTISSHTPQPSQYYLVVDCGTGVRWTSRVVTIADGYSEPDMTEGWTCEVTQLPCNEPTFVGIKPWVAVTSCR